MLRVIGSGDMALCSALSVVLCIDSNRVVVGRGFLPGESNVMFAAGEWAVSPQLDSLAVSQSALGEAVPP